MSRGVPGRSLSRQGRQECSTAGLFPGTRRGGKPGSGFFEERGYVASVPTAMKTQHCLSLFDGGVPGPCRPHLGHHLGLGEIPFGFDVLVESGVRLGRSQPERHCTGRTDVRPGHCLLGLGDDPMRLVEA
jgi:hypothetical protein